MQGQLCTSTQSLKIFCKLDTAESRIKEIPPG